MKSPPKQKPKLAGLDERDLSTNETDVPTTYFAGVGKLNGSAIMNPIISKTRTTPSQEAKK